MVYTQPSSCPREWHTQTLMGLWHTNRTPNLGQKTRLYNNQPKQKKKKKRKENLQNCGFSRPSWPQNKTEGKWKEGSVPVLAREMKKLWNIQVTIIPIVIGTFGTVTKELLKGLEDLEVGGRV